MEPSACVWQRVCSRQREASPASPAFPLPPASSLPVLPLVTLRAFVFAGVSLFPFCCCFYRSAPAFVYCFAISSSSSSASPAQLTFFFSSYACQISQHISNSRRIRWSNSLCMPTLTLLWHAPHTRHAPGKSALCSWCLRLVWQHLLLLLLPLLVLMLNYDSFCYACCDFGNSY